MTSNADVPWLAALGEAIAASAPALGLDPDELLDVDLDVDGQPIGAGVDFVQRLDALADLDPDDETFAQSVADEVAAYAAEIQAEPVAAAGAFDTTKHPHNGTGPGGGQFSSTNTPAPRGKLTYSGKPQGTGRYGPGGSSSASPAQLTPVVATWTLRNGGNNDPNAVIQLQRLINELKLGGLEPNGTYTNATEAAVKAIQAKLGLKQTGTASPALIRRIRDAHALSPCVDKASSQVAASYVGAAAGHDVTPGHDELHHWWVYGAGRERWHTWTELYTQLLEHVTPENAKRMASAWFLERYGFASGSDLNRVKHGHPPRGRLVGPG